MHNIGTDEAIEVLLEAVKQDQAALRSRTYQLLGKLKAQQALPLMQERLTRLEQQYHQWRRIRDSEREDFSAEEAEKWRQGLENARPDSHWTFELAYAMARIDPEATGIELLSHDLAKMRYGAWMGLGTVGTVALVERLQRQRIDSAYPIFRHAAYRAIDHILINLEINGKPEDLEGLKTFYSAVKDQKDQKGVSTRVEWTILALEAV